MKTIKVAMGNGNFIIEEVKEVLPTRPEEVTSIYALGLEVIAVKERLYAAIRLSPTDMRYNDFLKYRTIWVKEIVALEKLYADTCYMYHNEPLPEVMARKHEFFTVGGVTL
ncbi:hypothetical protein DIGNKC_282 [Bacillus phage DIGNKC]|uniref:hypothetical protein n=1 Tax=Bacillus phage DIGNKC TaxID=1805948 RepID=UPI0007A76E88|nr:hypothetical protein BI007_gp092 [Bacillus phage DIGNKC]AMW62751.1 hypothetical protein DIGNKC_282 [Bacillus phage DIGNKC]